MAQDQAHARAQSQSATMKEKLRDEINKRLTLNWLIQGAAQHAGMTFHHLVRDELNALDPGLVLLYDQYALTNLLQYWHPGVAALFGSPSWFWWRAKMSPLHPFFGHPLLSKFGGILAKTGRQRGLERCKEKNLALTPKRFVREQQGIKARLRRAESPHRARLVKLAKHSASTVWGIPLERLDGELTDKVVLGDLIPARTGQGRLSRSTVVGYGGVVQQGDGLVVIGKGTNWQLLTKELVKGTAELICLHGLNTLSDETYEKVMDAADHIEFERWMLQTGGELWRRVLAVIPDDRPLAGVLMHLARLPPKRLQSLIAAAIEQPELARPLFDELGRGGEASGTHSDIESPNQDDLGPALL
jgi:hypothetical protein